MRRPHVNLLVSDILLEWGHQSIYRFSSVSFSILAKAVVECIERIADRTCRISATALHTLWWFGREEAEGVSCLYSNHLHKNIFTDFLHYPVRQKFSISRKWHSFLTFTARQVETFSSLEIFATISHLEATGSNRLRRMFHTGGGQCSWKLGDSPCGDKECTGWKNMFSSMATEHICITVAKQTVLLVLFC